MLNQMLFQIIEDETQTPAPADAKTRSSQEKMTYEELIRTLQRNYDDPVNLIKANVLIPVSNLLARSLEQPEEIMVKLTKVRVHPPQLAIDTNSSSK